MANFISKTGQFLTQLRVWAVNLFTLFVLLYTVVIVVMLVRQLPPKIDPEGKVLIISPQGLILDQEVYPTELNFPFVLPPDNQIQSRDLVRLIRAAADDERLAGVLVDFSAASFSGASTALRIADELAALRASGLPTFAYAETLSTAAYMMAAQMEQVFVHPSGAVAISGLGGYRDYTRDLTEKLRISIHNYSQGDYKSAVDGLTRNNMSDADREQITAFSAPIWSAIKQRMSSGRGLEPELFQTMADQHPVVLFNEAAYDNLAFAVEQEVIDGTLSFPDFRAMMIEQFGRSDDEERETYPHIPASAYLAQLPTEQEDAEDEVAVVFVEGAIRTGASSPGVAGAQDIAAQLRRAYENPLTQALVLRVNSPGGSVIGSDLIRDELVAAAARDLPVMVSMGDVAASGGVWVSTPADQIFAEPTTITGSIGVAIVFPTLENVFDYAGVHFDGVTTSQYAGWNLNLPVDERLDAVFARWASSAYGHFINSVATDRGQEPDYIRSIAGGRVWIAPDALERGLIDQLGTLEDAVAAAASQAGLEDYRVNYVVPQMSPAIALLRRFGVTSPVDLSLLGRVEALLEQWANVTEPRAAVMCSHCVLELN